MQNPDQCQPNLLDVLTTAVGGEPLSQSGFEFEEPELGFLAGESGGKE